jgi:peptidoglycan/xylan/chitin deacetylase (PgdA/CDA1 family)
MREYGNGHEPPPRVPRSRPRRERRSRLLAVIVLVVVAVVLLVVGLTGRSSDSGGAGGGETTPFSVLPLSPQTGSDTFDFTTTTSLALQSQQRDGDVVSVSTAGAVGPLLVAGGDAGVLTSTGTTLLKAGTSTPGQSASSLMAAMAMASAGSVPVLMYHYVADVPPSTGPYASGLTVRTGDFDDQMRYLARNGYQTVDLGDLYLARRGLKTLPPKTVILTFDDGGLDNYRVAFPIMVRYGFRGTFFVVTGKVGAVGQMDWDDLRAMADQGMSIESHTISHPVDLRAVDDPRLATELGESRTAIAQNLGFAPESLSYPSGRYDERVVAAARAAGYLLAVSTNSGSDAGTDADFQIRRIRVAAFESIGDFSSSLR